MRPTRKLQINIRYNMHGPNLPIWPDDSLPYSPTGIEGSAIGALVVGASRLPLLLAMNPGRGMHSENGHQNENENENELSLSLS